MDACNLHEVTPVLYMSSAASVILAKLQSDNRDVIRRADLLRLGGQSLCHIVGTALLPHLRVGGRRVAKHLGRHRCKWAAGCA